MGGAPTQGSDLTLVEGFGRGVMADVKEKAKFYKSDFTDGVSIKVSLVVDRVAELPPLHSTGGVRKLPAFHGGPAGPKAPNFLDMKAPTTFCNLRRES